MTRGAGATAGRPSRPGASEPAAHREICRTAGPDALAGQKGCQAWNACPKAAEAIVAAPVRPVTFPRYASEVVVKDKQGRRVLPNLLNPPPRPAPPRPERAVDPLIEEVVEDQDFFMEAVRAQAEELEALKESRPLGAVVHREPKSLEFSKVPDPVWKRKLRP